MIKVSNKHEKHLLKYFPYLLDIDLNDEPESKIAEYYNIFAVSIFDHWLTEKEADNFLYKYLWHGSYTDSCNQYKTSEDKYLSFFQKLSHLDRMYFFTENLGIEEVSASKSILWKVETSADLKKLCLANIREESFFRLFLPKLHLVIRGNFDMTQIVYSTKESNLDLFRELVKTSQLHILN